MPDGTSVRIEATLTLDLGSIDGSRGGFVQDDTAGIGLYLDAAIAAPVPAGTRIRATGVMSSRYSQRTIKVSASDIAVLGVGSLPIALVATTGLAGEPLEGRRLELAGVVTEAPADLADGLGLMIDDGTGPVRVIAGPAALGDLTPVTGSMVVARGPLGQRDSGGTGLLGYRLFATLPGELAVVMASPSPTPTPAPTPSAMPSPTLTPSPSATPSPSITSTPSPTAIDITTARALPVGSRVVVRGVVIAEAGRLGTPSLLVIGDAGGGLPVRLPDGIVAPPRGTMLEVTGTIADPYGQTELRTVAGGIVRTGLAALPVPYAIDPGMAGEALEGRLVTTYGIIATSATKATSDDLSFRITGPDGVELIVRTDGSAGFTAASLAKGLSGTFTGIIGQRASRKGVLDGYRLWLRDAADIVPTGQTPTPSPAGSPAPSAGDPVIAIGTAISRDGDHVVVEGVVTVGVSLLDTSRRRTVIEDTTGAIEVYLPAPDPAVRVGARLRVTGTVGRAYGAPRLKADAVVALGSTQPAVHTLHVMPTEAREWQLVRVSGTVVELHKLGARWRAELDANGLRIPVSGLDGSGIDASHMVVGRLATIVGIARRAYPTAADQRFAIVPRSLADVDLAPSSAVRGRPGSVPASRPGAATGAGSGRPGPFTDSAAQDIDLDQLSGHIGHVVRVGGIVAALAPDGVDLDDGTATAPILLTGDAATVLALLEPGDVLNAVGTPEQRDQLVLVVDDPAGLVLAGGTGVPAAGGLRPSATPATQGGDRVLALAGISSDMGVDLAPAGLGTMLLLALASVAVTALRRHHARRAIRARVVARLAAFGAPGRDGGGPAGH